MFSITKLLQRARQTFRAAAPTPSRLKNYNILIKGINTSDTRKRAVVMTTYQSITLQEVIDHMENTFHEPDSLTLPMKVQLACLTFQRLLKDEAVEIKMKHNRHEKAWEALAELDKAKLLPNEDITRKKLRKV